MLKFLNKSYPFNDDLKHNAKIILFISLGILAFLLLFQPIEISSFTKIEIFYLVTGFAASTFLILTINLIILPSLFPKLFYNNVWNIKREIIWDIWILLTISISNFLFYTKLFGLIDMNFSDIARITLTGFLPVVVIIIINQDRLLRSHLKSAQKLNEKLSEGKSDKLDLIYINSDYKNDDLVIHSDALVLIKSADNYIEVYYENEGSVEKQMVRSSIKKVEQVIKDFDFIVKCHRSFIVNVNYIKEVKGNSQGYKLFFKNIESQALVSQKYIKEFSKIIS